MLFPTLIQVRTQYFFDVITEHERFFQLLVIDYPYRAKDVCSSNAKSYNAPNGFGVFIYLNKWTSKDTRAYYISYASGFSYIILAVVLMVNNRNCLKMIKDEQQKIYRMMKMTSEQYIFRQKIYDRIKWSFTSLEYFFEQLFITGISIALNIDTNVSYVLGILIIFMFRNA